MAFLPSQRFRPTWAEIDLAAFSRNAAFLARRAGKSRIVAVLKADGYGHGAVPLARLLERRPPARFWGFGVSSVEEGVSLREGGIKGRVLILGSLFPFDSFGAALEFGLTPTIASWASARALAKEAERRGIWSPLHVKVDTGMGRIGMSPATALQTISRMMGLPSLRVGGVYTHLAQAEDAKRRREQIALFKGLVSSLAAKGPAPLFHTANSAGMLLDSQTHFDLVRPGLALYGASPVPGVRGLSPVMTWKTRVVFLKEVAKGVRVSYGGTWRAPKRSRLATLPVGYADGYRRGFSGKASVLVRGRRCPVAGRVTMDQIVVDVTGLPRVTVGEEVVLMGKQGREEISAGELAEWAGTIPYEIFCGISARVPREPR